MALQLVAKRTGASRALTNFNTPSNPIKKVFVQYLAVLEDKETTIEFWFPKSGYEPTTMDIFVEFETNEGESS